MRRAEGKTPSMKRRSFIKSTAVAGLAIGLGRCTSRGKTHVLTLSFDDGFKDSFYRTAAIHEEFGLAACLNVIASAHFPGWVPPDEYQTKPVGNFDDWNALKARGHEVMPHTWAHANLTEMPLDEAKQRIDRCLEYFTEHLDGFEPSKAVYNFAFNASTPELESYVLSRVWGIRTGGEDDINPFPTPAGPFRLACGSFGPENADQWVEQQVNRFLETDGGWLVLNLHGLDEEGWGPVSTDYLRSLLRRLVPMSTLEVLPTGVALEKYAG
jgi:peptidoglycan/xylan/chitin deacetylase (PgdA/CDA1 family)